MQQDTAAATIHPLAQFAATLRWSDIPPGVQRKAEDLLVDWFGSVLAGQSARPVRSITRFALSQGPAQGACEVIGQSARTSPMMAAMANAAASHVAEQDDVHNGSVFHPAAVVFPPALAVAQSIGASGERFMAACVAGYEVGIRVGEFLGRSHYRIFHTTGTAGTIAAAAAVGHLLELTPQQMQHAFGSAGTQAAGLWEFLRTAADSKQLHTAHAASAGLTAAYLAKDGFTGAQDIFTGPQGMAAGMSTDSNPERLVDGLGARWATPETSFKWHASCRHTHPAADALLQVMQQHQLKISDIAQVTCHVHQGAIDVLGPVVSPATVHQSKFSMGTVLAIAARFGHAGLTEFDEQFLAPDTVALRDKVRMVLDAEVDAAYPQRWIGKVSVQTADGRTLHGRVDEPKGDPGNTLSRAEIEGKVLRLATYGSDIPEDKVHAAVQSLWSIAKTPRLGRLLD
ncbi:MmgE/PrpD family protein [Diaphorobacter caeni]|uniref:MmgE/PrpD family protein n=1 Tax=Diaphorobacter caeni TaxID=2784387 RepID=UPI00188FBD62|nr:MmgE/PrpD family protein [Diaphorobacter caeni]MBF5005277.1 MmgE/PrpD family protein [Diaphorobacter caeni]